jgi:hypothetical protein
MANLNNYQVFPREYFSGVDCYIAFDNIPLTQIVTISFAAQEPIIPIYGYASYTYDAVAHGARIVTGSFTIAFKESLYIRSALEKLRSNGTSSASTKSVYSSMSKGELSAWVKGRSVSSIEALADEYSEKLWGNSNSEIVNKEKNPFFTVAGSSLSEYGFDIIISYGSELLELGKKIRDYPGTVKLINGVHLTGVTQRVAPTGEPIYEEYSFIAKDLDNTL